MHDFCLAHLFTAIPFISNVMGLASPCGICGKSEICFTYLFFSLPQMHGL